MGKKRLLHFYISATKRTGKYKKKWVSRRGKKIELDPYLTPYTKSTAHGPRFNVKTRTLKCLVETVGE